MTNAPKQGTMVALDASKSYDRDVENMAFKWWVLSEARTYTENVKISNSTARRATVEVPSDAAGRSFHVICELTDDGTHNLSGFRRMIFNPTNYAGNINAPA